MPPNATTETHKAAPGDDEAPPAAAASPPSPSSSHLSLNTNSTAGTSEAAPVAPLKNTYGSIRINNYEAPTPASSEQKDLLLEKREETEVVEDRSPLKITSDDDDKISVSGHNVMTAVPIKNESSYDNNKKSKTRTTSLMQHQVERVLIKTPSSSFWEDASVFRSGSVPHSIVLALTIGIVCGTAAWLYYAVLEYSLDFLWHVIPEHILIDHVPEALHWLWIPILGFSLAVGVGVTVRYLGEPGDLPYTIKCVHEKAYVDMDHVLPMVGASQFSILAGGSLGPEAPLVAICAALGGYVSQKMFGVTERNLVRKHTLMGMAGALAAFFGCPLGGSLFALEVNSRMGVEYFEHAIEAIFCGEVCLGVFRALARLPIQYIWTLPEGVEKLDGADAIELLYGCILGFVGAGVAWCFKQFHLLVMAEFGKRNLLDAANQNAIKRALVGAVVIVTLGVLIPHTMFWGEDEFQTVWTMSPASTLEHIWPTTGLTHYEMNSFWSALLLGIAKLIAISFTVSGGYRGGYIFPLFCSGAALGRAIHCICPFIPMQLCVLCMAASMNVAITRTAIATTLILSYLSGEQAALSSVLAAALVSLFATAYMPFIKTQVDRSDLEDAIFCCRYEEPDQEPEEKMLEVEPEEDEEDPTYNTESTKLLSGSSTTGSSAMDAVMQLP